MADEQNILLIQSNPDYVELVRGRLRKETGSLYHVYAADSLQAGIETLQNEEIHAVLLEMSLPDCDGLETYYEVQRAVDSVPVIIITGLDQEMSALQAVKNGAQDYLLKGEIEGELLPRILRNAIERSRMRAELQNLALTDDLTGLYNRRGFFLLAEQQLKLAKRNNSELVLLMMDVDSFKSINDEHGHLEGDAALTRVASILQECLRESDIVARMGGDEFAAVAIEAGTSHFPILVSRIQKRFEDVNASEKYPYNLSLSIGYAAFEAEKIVFVEQLLAKADDDLYRNKRKKKSEQF